MTSQVQFRTLMRAPMRCGLLLFACCLAAAALPSSHASAHDVPNATLVLDVNTTLAELMREANSSDLISALQADVGAWLQEVEALSELHRTLLFEVLPCSGGCNQSHVTVHLKVLANYTVGAAEAVAARVGSLRADSLNTTQELNTALWADLNDGTVIPQEQRVAIFSLEISPIGASTAITVRFNVTGEAEVMTMMEDGALAAAMSSDLAGTAPVSGNFSVANITAAWASGPAHGEGTWMFSMHLQPSAALQLSSPLLDMHQLPSLLQAALEGTNVSWLSNVSALYHAAAVPSSARNLSVAGVVAFRTTSDSGDEPRPTADAAPFNVTLTCEGEADVIASVFNDHHGALNMRLRLDVLELLYSLVATVSVNTTYFASNGTHFTVDAAIVPLLPSSLPAINATLHQLRGTSIASWANSTAELFGHYPNSTVIVTDVVTEVPAMPEPTTDAPPTDAPQTATPTNATTEAPTPTPENTTMPTMVPSDGVRYRVRGILTITGNAEVFALLLSQANVDGLKQRLAIDIATRLNVLAVEIVSVVAGSLVVEFVVPAASAADATQLQALIEAMAGDAGWLVQTTMLYTALATEEQRASASFPLGVLSAVATIETLDSDDDAGQSNVVVIVIIIIVVIIVIVVTAICCYKMNSSASSTGGEGASGGQRVPGRVAQSYASYAHDGGVEMGAQDPPAPGTI